MMALARYYDRVMAIHPVLDHPKWPVPVFLNHFFATGRNLRGGGSLQLRTLAASALLPNESMLKSAAAPNAAAENLWVLFKLVVFCSLGCDLV